MLPTFLQTTDEILLMPPPSAGTTVGRDHDQPRREGPIRGSGGTLHQATSTETTTPSAQQVPCLADPSASVVLQVAAAGGATTATSAEGQGISNEGDNCIIASTSSAVNALQLVGATTPTLQSKAIGVDKEIQTDPLYRAPKEITSSDDPEIAVKDEYRTSAKRTRQVK